MIGLLEFMAIMMGTFLAAIFVVPIVMAVSEELAEALRDFLRRRLGGD